MTDWVIDKSALWQLPRSPDYAIWIDRINAGRVWVGLSTVLEVAVSSRDADHWPRLREDLLGPLLTLNATPRSESVAAEIMEALVVARLHRSVPLPDVLTASLAVEHRLTVLTTMVTSTAFAACTGADLTPSACARPAAEALRDPGLVRCPADETQTRELPSWAAQQEDQDASRGI